MIKYQFFYEITTIEPVCGYFHVYYVHTAFPITEKKTIKPIPDKVRILIEDRGEYIVDIKELSFFKWFYLKYIHHNWIHPMTTFRIDWKKERI